MGFGTFENCTYETMTPKALANYCNLCHSYYDTPYCDCYTKSNNQKLNLYMVTVKVISEKLTMPFPTKGYRTYILDSNKVDAEARVIQLIGPEKISPNHMPTVEEVKGPFSKGQVLFWDEF